MKTFHYDGQEKPDWMLINNTTRPMFVPASPATLEVAGRRGVYFFRNKPGAKELSIDITILADNDEDLWQKIESASAWLDIGREAPLSISDEPGRFYNAVFVPDGNSFSPEAATGKATLTFLSPDPYKYGLSYTRELTDLGTPTQINNNGNTEMYPKFTIEFQNDADFFGIATANGFVQVGGPSHDDQTVIKPIERVLFDYCNDLAPYTTSGIVLDYGQAAGSFVVENGDRFKVSDYGDDANFPDAWHGPVMKRNIPEQVQDFRLTAFLQLSSSYDSKSRVEVYFLDAAGAVVARFIMWDRYGNAQLNTGHITSGPNESQEEILASWGPVKYAWNNFIGKFYLRRTGDYWQARVTKVDHLGRDVADKEVYRVHRSSNNNNPVAQVQIGVKRKSGTPDPIRVNIRDIIVERVNDVNTDAGEARRLFQAGDVLEIDHTTGSVWLNGEYYNEHLDPGSTFFGLPPGTSEVQALTTSGASYTAAVEYTERYK